MPSPYRSLPPLGTLRTFEAVARQLSFTVAAQELSLTQSAVSHQIRALEEHLGASLFGRLHRGIELTGDGRVLLEGVRAGLDSVLLASERVRSQKRVGVLTVAAPAAFATWWLVPRLGRFAALHPEIEVRIAAIDGREPDLWRDGVDVAVVKRAAKLADRNPLEMPLLREIVFPVCAPSMLGGEPPLRGLHDLVQHPLIECDAAAEVQPCRAGAVRRDRRARCRARALADGRRRARRRQAGTAVRQESHGQGRECVRADMAGWRSVGSGSARRRISRFRIG